MMEEDDNLLVIVGDDQAAGAMGVKDGMWAWHWLAMLRVKLPRAHPHNRQETSEAPDWPVH